jgi:hypothetical protein
VAWFGGKGAYNGFCQVNGAADGLPALRQWL